MSGIEAFFRHCPACGRRFEVRLVGKKEVGAEEFEVPTGTTFPLPEAAPGVLAPVLLQEGGPIIVDREDFQYSYLCKHCGHRWSEFRSKESETKAPEGYKGD